MRQSMIAGLVLCVIGFVLCAFPNKIWEITEKWKSENADQPTKSFLTLIRIISGALIGIGVLLVSGVIW